MKIIKAAIVLTTLGVCSTAMAVTNAYDAQRCGTGVYIGAQLGYGDADYGHQVGNSMANFPVNSRHEDGAAGRVYIGGQLTPVFGIEAGYSAFTNNTYEGRSNTAFSKVRLETQVIDLLATVGTPLVYEGFGLTLKGGAAYIVSDYNYSGNVSDLIFSPSSASNDRFAPVAGASIIYKLPNNFAADLSYLHVFAAGNVNAPRTDLVTLGLSYRFA